jgi:HD-GYP domain-containing protein (c-di-GMP phosphodiesterase class II)
MELPATDIERIRIGALLHDIGKIGIADRVLQKPGRLTEEEWRLIKQHPVIGRRILEGVHGFAPYLGAVELHHENWDGTGYPRGQMATETPIDARIIHVVDAYDAMTTDRSYRRAMTHERAISILTENAGSQFDARVVAIFLSLPAELLTRQTRASELRFDVEESMAVLD